MNTATQTVQATVQPTVHPLQSALQNTLQASPQTTLQPTPPTGLNTREQLVELLRQRRLAASKVERQAQISQDIWRRFGQTQAVLILDMAEFSHLAHCQGILEALTGIQDMNALVEPEILAQQGRLIKFEADNAFAVFPEVAAAVQAALNIFAAVAAAGIGVSIGIGYGDILVIEDPIGHADFYGDQVNLASKLGEDTARSGELMLTEAAYAQLVVNALADPLAWKGFHLVLANLEMTAYTWVGRPIHENAKSAQTAKTT
jgi:adenylate cyclase